MIALVKQRWLVGVLVVASLLAIILGVNIVQNPTSNHITVGDYGDWHTFQGWQSPYGGVYNTLGRWSNPDSRLNLPFTPSRYGWLKLRLVAPTPPARAVTTTLDLGVHSVEFAVIPQARQYQVFLPENTPQSIQIHLTQPETTSPQLGIIQLESLAWHAPLLAAGSALLWLTGIFLITFAIVWVWSQRWLWSLATVGMAGGVWLASNVSYLALHWSTWIFGIGLVLMITTWLIQRTEQARWWWSLAVTTVVAAAVRFYGLDWDDGNVLHPDEWVFNRAAWQMKPPWNPNFFSYGSFLLYLYRFTANFLANFDAAWLQDFGKFVLVGRFYSALWSTLTVIVIAYLGRRWRNWQTGIIAAGAWTLTVLSIQNAHFSTTDSLLTLLLLSVVIGSIRYAERPTLRRVAFVGFLLGTGFATKTTAAIFMMVPLLMLIALWWESRRLPVSVSTLTFHIGGCLATMALTCFMFAPYYVLDWPAFSQTIAMEGSDLSSGLATYTYQFIGTPPYLFQLYNLLLTCSPLLIIVALIGWGSLARQVWQQRQASDTILWLAPTVYFLLIGLAFIKYNRYLVPILPFVCLFASNWLWQFTQKGGWKQAAGFGLGIITGLMLLTYTASFVIGVYGQPDPRLTASAWIYQNIPFESNLLTEEQEHAVLPLLLNDLYTYLYSTKKLEIYKPSVMESLGYYIEWLQTSDYMLIASRTHYLPFMRNPELFPVRACVYTQIFNGSLGFEPIKTFTRGMYLGPWRLDPPAHPYLEETFQVFDHPTVMILGKVDQERVAQLSTTLTNQCGHLSSR